MLIALSNSATSVLVAGYLLTRTPFFLQKPLLEKTYNFKLNLSLIVFFGFFSIYGTLSGFRIDNAIANTRYIAPVVAGLIAGPVVGFGAGLIGGLHRLLDGNFASIPSAISTTVAGLAAGLYFKYKIKNRDGFAGVVEASVFALIIQLYHLGQALVFENFTSSDFARGFAIVKAVFVPMVLANSIGTGIFAYMISNLYNEKKTLDERDNFLKINTRIESELKIATDIQMSMVPTVFVTVPHKDEFKLFATMQPAKEVGGDFYDFFLVDDEKLFFVVGDVSDKGVPAALFMAVTKSFIKALGKTAHQPHQLLNLLNHYISEENKTLMFVTIFCGYLNYKTGELEYTNAGHNPPIILRADGNVEMLELPPGCVLGVSFGEECNFFSSKKIKLNPDDIIIAYTDGITEARNIQKDLFSESRLFEIIKSLKTKEPEEIVNNIENAVKNFVGTAPQADDLTVMALRYNKA